MRLFHSILSCLAVCCAAPLASAQYVGSPFSYNYLDINYANTTVDNDSPDLTGYGARVSFDSPEGIRILLSWDDTEGTENGVDYKRRDLEAGIGFASSQNNAVDMILDLKYLRGEQRVGDENKNRSGYGIEMGVRTLITEELEFDLSVEFRDFFISELGGRTSLRYMFTPSIGIGARYTYFESLTKWDAGLRFAF